MSNAPPIIITGMHRSGTSLTTNVLRQCGLWLGPEHELLGPTPSNPDGHWEKRAIVELNDVLLSEFGGGWDNVPDFPARWQEGFSAQRERAVEIHASLTRPTPWGWKDPRASVLMPFWYLGQPDARVVVSIRHPLEVATSLRLRGAMSYSLGLKLWRIYNERLLTDVPRHRRIVVHYEHFFTQPNKTLRRLVDFCGLAPSDDDISRIMLTVKSELRHTHFKAADLTAAQVAPETIHLYAQLCQEAKFGDAPLAPETRSNAASREVNLDALLYHIFLREWRRLVQQNTPEGALCAVVSKGEDQLLRLHNRKVWHFPQSAQGGYAGHHPEDSAEAIAHLEAVRAKGAEYFLIPAPSLWWLDYYSDFRKHLELHFKEIPTSNGLGRLFSLKPALTNLRPASI